MSIASRLIRKINEASDSGYYVTRKVKDFNKRFWSIEEAKQAVIEITSMFDKEYQDQALEFLSQFENLSDISVQVIIEGIRHPGDNGYGSFRGSPQRPPKAAPFEYHLLVKVHPESKSSWSEFESLGISDTFSVKVPGVRKPGKSRG